eukprot:6214847-Pleurochrysis_carterae.AAC.4
MRKTQRERAFDGAKRKKMDKCTSSVDEAKTTIFCLPDEILFKIFFGGLGVKCIYLSKALRDVVLEMLQPILVSCGSSSCTGYVSKPTNALDMIILRAALCPSPSLQQTASMAFGTKEYDIICGREKESEGLTPEGLLHRLVSKTSLLQYVDELCFEKYKLCAKDAFSLPHRAFPKVRSLKLGGCFSGGDFINAITSAQNVCFPNLIELRMSCSYYTCTDSYIRLFECDRLAYAIETLEMDVVCALSTSNEEYDFHRKLDSDPKTFGKLHTLILDTHPTYTYAWNRVQRAVCAIISRRAITRLVIKKCGICNAHLNEVFTQTVMPCGALRRLDISSDCIAKTDVLRVARNITSYFGRARISVIETDGR